MKKEFTVCNVCENPARGTKPYTVSSGGRMAELDLCSEHGEPFERFLPSTPVRPRRAAPRKATKATPAPAKRTGRRTTPFMTLDEIEAIKAAESA